MTQQPIFDIVLDQHKTLLLQMDGPGEVDLEQVRTFLKTLSHAGDATVDTEDRSTLLSLIRYWSSFIDNKTGEFPIIQLQPFDISLEQATSAKDLEGSLPILWNIPHPRNLFFTGRDDVLTRLHTQLQAGRSTSLSQIQAISGLGGIGKTQIAVEYAYRYHQEYEAVLWASAESQEALISSYSTIASLLSLPEGEASEQGKVIPAVKRWLQTHRNWLLILDNADDLDLLPSLLPPNMGGHLLLTTRAWDMRRLAQRLEVETFSAEQGALFLLRRAALIAPDAVLLRAEREDHLAAMQIAQELGGLPLALDQAGAYLEATGTSPKQYQHIYLQHRYALLRERRALVPDHPEPVATTWLLSFNQVEQHNAAAAELLRLCAYLASDAIPENIITLGAPHLGPLLEPVAADPFLLNQAIEVLRAYSLIHRDPRTQALSVHRLVQAVLRDRMASEIGKLWKQRVVRAVDVSCPNVLDGTQWDACEQWLPHALICASSIEQEQINSREAVSLLKNAGYYLDERARYAEAELLYKHALAIDEGIFGMKHATIAADLNCLAELYRKQRTYVEAELLYKRALAIREELLGPIHPDTATSLNNLALLYYGQGKYAEAEPLYERSLAIREEQLGPTHPDTATSLHDLARLHRKQGKYTEAEPLYKRALAIREEQLGPTHPDTTLSLNNLAGLYERKGRYAEAELLLKRVLPIYEQQLGPTHPWTAASLNDLARLYESQGKYAEAEPLYKRALAIREEQLGSAHPDTALCLNNLAGLYRKEGKYAEAEPLVKRALAIREEQLGPTHPDTALSLNNLALLYYGQEKYAEAEPLVKRALAIREEQLGSTHSDTATSLNDLAELYRRQGKYIEAEPLYTRALHIWEQALGPAHPLVARALNNLALLYYSQGKYVEAEPLYLRALTVREQLLGNNHPDTARSLNNLAALYQAQERQMEVEPLLKRALSIYEQRLGLLHSDTVESLNDLVKLYRKQGKYEEAELLYQRVLIIYEQLLRAEIPFTQTARRNYIDLLRNMGDDEKANKLGEKS